MLAAFVHPRRLIRSTMRAVVGEDKTTTGKVCKAKNESPSPSLFSFSCLMCDSVKETTTRASFYTRVCYSANANENFMQGLRRSGEIVMQKQQSLRHVSVSSRFYCLYRILTENSNYLMDLLVTILTIISCHFCVYMCKPNELQTEQSVSVFALILSSTHHNIQYIWSSCS